ncbi:MAG: DUF3341 domain-containing protein [Dehalococcoidia bacterium]
MTNRNMLALFTDADAAAEGGTLIQQAGIAPQDYEVLSGSPYPEGAFGEQPSHHRVYVFPVIGAFLGFAVGILLTVGTQISYPLVTGGKPILGIPPMVVVTYEGTMLGAILFTILGVLFESRLPRAKLGLYDPRITEGYIGLAISCPEELVSAVEEALKSAGAEEIKLEQRSA